MYRQNHLRGGAPQWRTSAQKIIFSLWCLCNDGIEFVPSGYESQIWRFPRNYSGLVMGPVIYGCLLAAADNCGT